MIHNNKLIVISLAKDIGTASSNGTPKNETQACVRPLVFPYQKHVMKRETVKAKGL